MATIEELEERIEHLEKVVYDELEYPNIVGARQKDFQKRDYERRGIKVLTKPQPEPLLDFSFHGRFMWDLIHDTMTMTFRRNRQGEPGSMFVLRDVPHTPEKFEIVSIDKINLKTFISMYWDIAGFDSLDEACRYYAATYTDDLGDAEAPDFAKIDGFMYKFRRVQND